MPEIPTFRTSQTRTGTRAIPTEAPLSTDIADVAGEAVGGGIAAVGKGIGDIGQALFQIEQEKQVNRDRIAASQANRTLDEWIADDIKRMENQKYKSINDLIKDRDDFKKRYNAKMNEVKQGLNERVSALFQSSSNNNFAAAQYHLARRVYQKEHNIAASEWGRNVVSLYQTMPPKDSPVYDQWKQKYDESRQAYSFYLSEADLNTIENQSRIIFEWEQAKAMDYETAIKYLNDLSDLPKESRNDLIARRKRLNEIETATTNRKVRWDTLRKVTEDPKSVTDDYLESLVKPNSLTWDDIEEFKKIRDAEDNPLKTPRAQIYLNSLDTLYESGVLDEFAYDVKNEKLTQFFKDNPTATAKQASEFYAELIKDESESWAWKMLMGAIERRPKLFGGKGLFPEKEAEGPTTKKEFDAAILALEGEELEEYFNKYGGLFIQ